jgi:hypothetical protein
MGTHVRENASIETVVDIVDATCAAVESDPATKSLAQTWAAMRDSADKLAENGRKLNREVLRARSRLNVQDSLWDATVAAFGRAVVDTSGGRRDQPPYTRFFSKATPSSAQDFGIQREIETARTWLAELARNPSEPLAQTWTPRLTEATDALEASFNQRNETVSMLAQQQTSVVLLIDDVNREIDRLEGDLKKLFPGAPDRVASYLAATRPSRRGTTDQPDPAPAPSPATK